MAHLPHPHRISQELFDLSFSQHTQMRQKEKRGNPTTVDGTGNMTMDLTGALAHNGTLEVVDSLCETLGILPLKKTPYLIPGLRGGDEFDFQSPNGRAADVKGNTITKWNAGLSKYQRLKVYDHQYGRPMDDYIFTVVDQNGWMLYVVGVISKQRFWKIATPQVSENTRANYHYVTPDQIPISLADYLRWCQSTPSPYHPQ